MRTVMDAILYIASTGCQWRQSPKDFPPYSTVQGYFYAWRATAWLTRSTLLSLFACDPNTGNRS
jgi:transposase